MAIFLIKLNKSLESFILYTSKAISKYRLKHFNGKYFHCSLVNINYVINNQIKVTRGYDYQSAIMPIEILQCNQFVGGKYNLG